MDDEMTHEQARAEITGIVERLKPKLVIEYRGNGVSKDGWVHHKFNLSAVTVSGLMQGFPFKTGIAHVDKDGKPTMPDPLEVLAYHAADTKLADPDEFRMYCEDAGIEWNCQKARDLFYSCLRSESKLIMLGFTKDEIRRMGELSSYL